MKIATLSARIRIERIGREKLSNDNTNYTSENSQNHKKFVSDIHHLAVLYFQNLTGLSRQYFIFYVHSLQCLGDSTNEV